MPCPACGCSDDAPSHAVCAALGEDDLDAAFDAGLLEVDPCPTCTGRCATALIDAREERKRALDARERYRKRGARLEDRARQRENRRAEAHKRPAALPPAAAAALARALSHARKPR